jgi:hypothetical protein
MWFKVENKRNSTGQKFLVRCNSEIAGNQVIEERPAKGTTAARKTAEILASSLNVTATVYGADSAGEFVYGVYEVSEGGGCRPESDHQATICGICICHLLVQGSITRQYPRGYDQRLCRHVGGAWIFRRS